MAKTTVSVSKKNNSVWRIYFYDTNEEGKYYFGTQRINPLLILYYKLIRRHRKQGACSICGNVYLFLTNWYDKKMDCPNCLDDYDDYEN